MAASVPITTVTLGSDAELARRIINGLNSGAYELVGGVVRRTDNKQVVAWLRQTGEVSPATLSALSLNPPALHTLSVLLAFLQPGVIVGGFAIIYQRLEAIRKELEAIKQMLAKIGKQIDLTVDARFFAALDRLRTLREMHHPRNRRSSAEHALTSFLEVEHYYRGRLDMELHEGWTVVPLLKMMILARVGAMHCYLELGENDVARRYLAEGREHVIEPYLWRWYDMVIGVEPALFLHPETGISLRRLALLMRWRKNDPSLTGEETLEDLPAAIWRIAREGISISRAKFPPSLRDDPPEEGFPGRIRIPFMPNDDNCFLKRLGTAFEQIETLYGAVRCLEGYQIELEQMERLGVPPATMLPAPSSAAELMACVPNDSELLPQERRCPWLRR